MKPIMQRLWPKVGVAKRLAAKGLFAARLCMWIATWASTFGLFDRSSNKELLLRMEEHLGSGSDEEDLLKCDPSGFFVAAI